MIPERLHKACERDRWVFGSRSKSSSQEGAWLARLTDLKRQFDQRSLAGSLEVRKASFPPALAVLQARVRRKVPSGAGTSQESRTLTRYS